MNPTRWPVRFPARRGSTPATIDAFALDARLKAWPGCCPITSRHCPNPRRVCRRPTRSGHPAASQPARPRRRASPGQSPPAIPVARAPAQPARKPAPDRPAPGRVAGIQGTDSSPVVGIQHFDFDRLPGHGPIHQRQHHRAQCRVALSSTTITRSPLRKSPAAANDFGRGSSSNGLTPVCPP